MGGTRFIRPFILRHLIQAGHEVTLFYDGQHETVLPSEVKRILGDRERLTDFVNEFKRFAPQVVLDIVPFTEQDAQSLISIFRGIAKRVVVVSSQDVYRACGVWLGEEDGLIDPVPLTEDSPLRQVERSDDNPCSNEQFYYEIMVEEAVMSNPDMPGTVLRLPRVYGPGSHNLFSYLKYMDDKRPAFLLEESSAQWRRTRGYVENVAEAIAWAVADDRAINRVYNIGELEALSQVEWVREIGRAAGWDGEIVAVPKDILPEHLKERFNFSQHMVVDTTRLRTELGYSDTTSREEALCRTIHWLRMNLPDKIDSKQFDYAAEDEILARLKRHSL
jgi:nucleoside-diphosphate-sugar epimerase